MPRFGSDANSLSQSIAGVSDESGNQLVDTSVDFFASPLGVAPRAQALFGIANAQFNLLPPDPSVQIVDFSNPLPYWSVDNLSNGLLTATSTFDTTTGTWGVLLNPTAGSANDSITLKTRSYLLNDDSLALRQKAFLTLAKSGTAAGTTQFNVVLTAEYFDANDASLSGGTAYAIGTALDTATFTTINGFTTTGSTAIGSSAAYVDIKVTLTCSATVTGSAKATVKLCLLATKSAVNSSFVIAETFTGSTTFTPPTGVTNLVAIVGVGAGGGGASGSLATSQQPTDTGGKACCATGGASGAASPWFILRNVAVNAGSAITVGIGAGGVGGTAMVFTKAATLSTISSQNGAAGGAGGVTTFGSFVSLNGGSGGLAGTANNATTAPRVPTAGGTVQVATASYYGLEQVAATAGTSGGTAGISSAQCVGATAPASAIAYAVYPFTSGIGLGASGATGTSSSNNAAITAVAGTGGTAASGTALWGLSGGGGGGATLMTGTFAGNGGPANAAFGSGGGGGAAISMRTTLTSAGGTGTALAGAGGSAGSSSGGGGGGGGAATFGGTAVNTYDNMNLTLRSGAGGAGASGFITIVYVA